LMPATGEAAINLSWLPAFLQEKYTRYDIEHGEDDPHNCQGWLRRPRKTNRRPAT